MSLIQEIYFECIKRTECILKILDSFSSFIRRSPFIAVIYRKEPCKGKYFFGRISLQGLFNIDITFHRSFTLKIYRKGPLCGKDLSRNFCETKPLG